MNRAENKTMRLDQIEALLMDHPEGMTQADLARRLGVHRSTILRNLADTHAPIYEDHHRFYLDREAYLVNLHLTLHEALSIHLAGRLMASCIDRRNPYAASMLRKLGISLEKLAPLISHFICSSADAFDDDSKRQDPHYLQVLEKITLAWAEKRKLQLWYRGAEEKVAKEYLFCPYYVEVGALGQAVYAIGRIEPQNEMRTFKIERVERIELLKQSYSIPKSFNPQQLFNNAWGIWYTDQPPVKIVLRFSSRVASRVKETRWHPTEEVVQQPDGTLLWSASIAEPREMQPWIRGWGADVEVLEPQELREKIKEETKILYQKYSKEES